MKTETDYALPCDVTVAPATRVAKGCSLSTLLAVIESRRGVNLEDPFPGADYAELRSVLGAQASPSMLRNSFEKWYRNGNSAESVPMHYVEGLDTYSEDEIDMRWSAWKAASAAASESFGP